MRTVLFASCFSFVVTVSITAGAAESAPSVQLRGIIGISDKKYALLQVSTEAKRAKGVPPQVPMPMLQHHMMLAPGEGEGDVEVVEIEAAKGEVKVRNGTNVFTVAFPADSAAGVLVTASKWEKVISEEVPFLRLGQMSLLEFLRLYQELSHRTLIRPTSLASGLVGGMYSKGPVSKEDVIRAMDRAMMTNGIVMVRDGEKFVVAVGSEREVEPTMSRLRQVREFAATIERTRTTRLAKWVGQDPHAATPRPVPKEEAEIPAGMINFPNTESLMVLPVYSQLMGRSFIYSSLLPLPNVIFVTQNPLTLEEAIYGLGATFALNGISFAAAGDKFVLVFLSRDEQGVGDLLKMKGPLEYTALTNMIPAGTFALPASSLDVFAGLYGKLAGRSVEIGDGVPRPRMSFNTAIPLTEGEALQGMDWLFGLNGLKVIEGGAGGLKIVRHTDDR
jgi:hypothetical protein